MGFGGMEAIEHLFKVYTAFQANIGGIDASLPSEPIAENALATRLDFWERKSVRLFP